MITDKMIARINELSRKSKTVGLTAAEKEEQAVLRGEYIASIRQNLRGQLSNIDVKNEDGSVENLGEKYGQKAEENLTKKDIRKAALKRRDRLNNTMLEHYSELICSKVIGSEQYRKADCVYVYMSYNSEVATNAIIEAAWKDGKKVAAPKVQGEDMTYYYIHSYDDVKPGYFNIPEPEEVNPADDEEALLIVPGVAFDRERNRCGYGKGFYDRYLEKHAKHPTIALCFDTQLVAKVPSQETDIKPDVLMTETGIY